MTQNGYYAKQTYQNFSFSLSNTPNGGWNGKGIFLNPGEEKTLDENDFGAFEPYLNVQNQSPNTGSFDVKF